MSDLKPCPFCGDDAEWVDIHDDEYGNTGGSVIECVSCGASTHVEFGFKENLTSAWNRRAASRELVPAMAARIEELEAKLKTYDEIGWALEEDAGQLRAKLAKAVGLVQQAFNEGFGSGMDDVLKSSGGRTWYDSRSRKRLAEINGGGDT